MSQNLISKYLFLEQKAQSLYEFPTFLTKAGGSINIFSESTHIEALIKACKIMEIKKKSYLYNPNVHSMHLLVPYLALHCHCRMQGVSKSFYLPKCGPQCQLPAPFNGTGQVAVLNGYRITDRWLCSSRLIVSFKIERNVQQS